LLAQAAGIENVVVIAMSNNRSWRGDVVGIA
jgi:hypothetical protein